MFVTRLKYWAIATLLGIVRLISWIGRIFFRVILFVFLKPLGRVGVIILRYGVVPVYKASLLLSKRLQLVFKSSKNGVLWIFTTRRTVHAVFAVIVIFVLAHNVFVEEVSADEFGQDTIMLSLVNESAQDVVETADSVVLYQGSVIKDELASIDAQTAIQESLNPAGDEIAGMTQGSIVQPNLTGSEPGSVYELEEQYVVQEGETISEIAEQFGVSTQTILDENNLTERSFIRPGQTLTILVTPSGKAVRHEIKRGDTLSKIAQTYNVSEESILDFNNLTDADSLAVGDTLIIDGARKPTPQPTTTLARVSNFFSTPTNIGSAAPSGGSFAWPSPDRRVNQGVRAGHVAIDIECSNGQSLFAAESGTVSSAGWSGGYGLRIVINHGGGVQTLYGHFSSLYVSAGQSVSRGQAIGMCGSTGYSTGTHLHLEVRVGGKQVNPWTYLR